MDDGFFIVVAGGSTIAPCNRQDIKEKEDKQRYSVPCLHHRSKSGNVQGSSITPLSSSTTSFGTHEIYGERTVSVIGLKPIIAFAPVRDGRDRGFTGSMSFPGGRRIRQQFFAALKVLRF